VPPPPLSLILLFVFQFPFLTCPTLPFFSVEDSRSGEPKTPPNNKVTRSEDYGKCKNSIIKAKNKKTKLTNNERIFLELQRRRRQRDRERIHG
jgi:hypothetical protein